MVHDPAKFGWSSNFPTFRDSPSGEIRERLSDYLPDSGPQQIRAWDESIPRMQSAVAEFLRKSKIAERYQTILEYELPMESRRTDVIFLISGSVVVVELKGKERPSLADIDQASAYGRDLRCYHKECANTSVPVLLVPTRASGYLGKQGDVHILGPDHLEKFLEELDRPTESPPVRPEKFLASEAYRPLPTLVRAARELMQSGSIRVIHRAHAATAPAIREISRLIHEAARTRTRKLILLSGVPGAGKTLVGLQIAHAHFLDDLSIPRDDGKPTAPAVYLSGNGPLVEVLQYELRNPGGGGRTFVRGVKDYVSRYSKSPKSVPPEHVLVFDEAQRAYDADKVKQTHEKKRGKKLGTGPDKSEPEHFIDFADRIPAWCVVIGLIGSGQEINKGEEGGVVQWNLAVNGSQKAHEWSVHLPPGLRGEFGETGMTVSIHPDLNLDTELRFHLAADIHSFVENLLEKQSVDICRKFAGQFEIAGYHLRLTRDLEKAKAYLKERYQGHPDARYGIVASSRDKDLMRFGIQNDYQFTSRLRVGPWYGDQEGAEGGHSCRHMMECVTEYGAQGLELDATLLAWGTDFMREDQRWTIRKSRKFQRGSIVRDPHQLRVNAYRVLLTRGRDGTVIYVPSLPELDQTFTYLMQCGFRPMDSEVHWID